MDAHSYEQQQRPPQLQPLAPSQPLARRDLAPLRPLAPLAPLGRDGSPALSGAGGGGSLGARRMQLRALESSPGADAYAHSGLSNRGHGPAPLAPAQRLDFGAAPVAAAAAVAAPFPDSHPSQLHRSRDLNSNTGGGGGDGQSSRRSTGGGAVPPPRYGEERERRGSGGGGGGGPGPGPHSNQHHQQQPPPPQSAQAAHWDARGPAPYNPDPASTRRSSGGRGSGHGHGHGQGLPSDGGRFDERRASHGRFDGQRHHEERLDPQGQRGQQGPPSSWQRPARMQVEEEDGGQAQQQHHRAAVDSSMRFHASAGAEGFYGSQPSFPPSNVVSPQGIVSPSGVADDAPSPAPLGYYGRESGGGGGGGGDRGPAPPSSRMPATPLRATFSPHASKFDPHASPLGGKDGVESVRAKGAEKNAPVLMTSMEELLSPAALQRYIPLFARVGHDAGAGPLPLAALVDMDDAALDAWLDRVDAEGDVLGVELTPVHREQIVWRVKQEREKRVLADPYLRRQRQLGVPVDRELGRVAVLSPSGRGGAAAAAGGVDDTGAGGNAVVLDGVRGLLRHWCCCLGLCVLSLLLALAFLLLYTKVGLPAMDSGSGSGGGGVNGGSVSSATEGGWKFLYILSILGFIFGGVAALMAVLSWMRNPATRGCNFANFCASCRALERPRCPDWGEVCKCGDCDCDCCPASLGCGACAGEVRSCLRECGQGVRDLCHLPECPECDCSCGGCSCGALMAECGCAECAAPECKECCPDCGDCGCADCAGCGDDCCKCEAPSCDCDCCPDCEGDIRGCCSVLYKVCCCQCKIQVA